MPQLKLKQSIIFWELVFLATLRNMHTYILTPLIRPFIKTFSLSFAIAGLVLGLYMFLSAIASLLWSLISDIRGIARKSLISSGIFGAGLFSLLCYIISNPFLFALFYIFGGMAIAVVNPFSITIISDTFKSGERTERLMLLNVLGGVGMALGFGIGLASNAYFSDWKVAMLIVSVIILTGIPISMLMPEPPKGLSEEIIGDIVLRKGYPFRLKKEDFYVIAGIESNKYIVFQGIFGTVANGAIQFWIIQYFVYEVGMSETAASVFLAISSLGALGGIVIAGLADRLYMMNPRYKPLVAAVCSAIEGVFFTVFFIMPIKANIASQDFVEAAKQVIVFLSNNVFALIASMLFFVAMIFNSSVGSIRNSSITDVNLPEYRSTVVSGADVIETFTKGIGTTFIGLTIDITRNIRYTLVFAMLFWFLSSWYWGKLSRVFIRDIEKKSIELFRRREKMVSER